MNADEYDRRKRAHDWVRDRLEKQGGMSPKEAHDTAQRVANETDKKAGDAPLKNKQKKKEG